MKRKFLFMSVLASLFLTGCSQEDVLTNGEENDNGKANTSYLAVNLVSSDGRGTRAADGYVDGDATENKVTSVRFYFFTAEGEIAPVKPSGNTYVNYFDYTPTQNDDKNENDDIESILDATIVINTKAGDKLPESIAAVLNPPTIDGVSLLGNESLDLQTLKDKVTDFATTGLTSEGSFVMFNSVYGDNNKEVCAVPVTKNNLKKTPDEAKGAAVDIYVERSVAKVKVDLAETYKANYNDGKLKLTDKSNNALKVGDKQVYLEIKGWSLTAESTEGRLGKAINPGWEYDWWNKDNFGHRSFWAINSENAANKYPVNYKDITTAFGNGAKYTNENAEDYTGTNLKRTKVIIAGRLCDENGKDFTIVRHLGFHFADDPDKGFPDLKASILSQLRANGYNFYKQKTTGNQKERKQIEASDIKIVNAKKLESEDSKNNCYVYAQLIETNTGEGYDTDDSGKTIWYISSDVNNNETISYDNLNTTLSDKDIVSWALAWNKGMTYYYYEIIHNNPTKGVVRNHFYDTTITKIAGLGTPVYNPEEIIYPEKPDENDNYIAAKINILSWRIVGGGYALEW